MKTSDIKIHIPPYRVDEPDSQSPPMNAEALIQEIIEDIRDMENENVLVAKMRMLASLPRE